MKIFRFVRSPWTLILVEFAKFIYVTLSLIVLNLIIILFIAEYSLRVVMPQDEEYHTVNAVIAAREVTIKHEAEYVASERRRYLPFALWRRFPYVGETINIDESGVRLTPGVDCTAGSYTVFAFGGSTMWGAGVPDWATIPAFLRARLSEFLGRPVCIINFGESGYVARQSLALLLSQLHSNHIPDLVIFYDGFNDVYSAYENGTPDKHTEFYSISRKLERNKEGLLLAYLSELTVLRALRDILWALRDIFVDEEDEEDEEHEEPKDTDNEESPANALSQSLAYHFFATYDVVEAVAQKWGFDFVFFVQPIIWLGDKPLTEEEERVGETYREYFPRLAELGADTYRVAMEQASPRERMFFIQDVFDNVEADIWYDLAHVSEEGNELVAERMSRTIRYLIDQDLP